MLLGYGPNPYETAAAKRLTDEIIKRMAAGLAQTFKPDTAESLKRVIADAVTDAGAPRQLVILFSAVAALTTMATKMAVNPPGPHDFEDINQDTLRKFRAHLWDTLSIGNVVQRRVLDEYRVEEIKRRRS